MAWTTPKEDWGATDAVPHTSLNAIGANLAYLHQEFDVSECVGIVGISVPASSYYEISEIPVSVPNGYTFGWRGIRAYFHTLASFQIYTSFGGVYYSYDTAVSAVDDQAGGIIYTNSSGSAVLGNVQFRIHNHHTSAILPDHACAFWVRLSIQPV